MEHAKCVRTMTGKTVRRSRTSPAIGRDEVRVQEQNGRDCAVDLSPIAWRRDPVCELYRPMRSRDVDVLCHCACSRFGRICRCRSESFWFRVVEQGRKVGRTRARRSKQATTCRACSGYLTDPATAKTGMRRMMGCGATEWERCKRFEERTEHTCLDRRLLWMARASKPDRGGLAG